MPLLSSKVALSIMIGCSTRISFCACITGTMTTANRRITKAPACRHALSSQGIAPASSAITGRAPA